MNKISDVFEVFQNNLKSGCCLLLKRDSYNVRTIIATIKCDYITLDINDNYNEDDEEDEEENKKEDEGSKENKYNNLVINIFQNQNSKKNKAISTFSNSQLKMSIALQNISIINIYNFSIDFITESGIDFSYVNDDKNSSINLLNEWIYKRDSIIKSCWIKPDLEYEKTMEDFVYKKQPEKLPRFFNIS